MALAGRGQTAHQLDDLAGRGFVAVGPRPRLRRPSGRGPAADSGQALRLTDLGRPLDGRQEVEEVEAEVGVVAEGTNGGRPLFRVDVGHHLSHLVADRSGPITQHRRHPLHHLVRRERQLALPGSGWRGPRA